MENKVLKNKIPRNYWTTQFFKETNILATILIVLFGTVAILLISALFMKKEYNIQREIIINKPLQNVFN